MSHVRDRNCVIVMVCVIICLGTWCPATGHQPLPAVTSAQAFTPVSCCQLITNKLGMYTESLGDKVFFFFFLSSSHVDISYYCPAIIHCIYKKQRTFHITTDPWIHAGNGKHCKQSTIQVTGFHKGSLHNITSPEFFTVNITWPYKTS